MSSLLSPTWFQSTLPVWGGTACNISNGTNRAVSIHPPRVGRDTTKYHIAYKAPSFNPPSPCGEGHDARGRGSLAADVSIHPPRVGRDEKELRMIAQALNVSIHPPRVGRDDPAGRGRIPDRTFQSTLPVWGGTVTSPPQERTCKYVSIHPPRVGRDTYCTSRVLKLVDVSIHPPRVGRDVVLPCLKAPARDVSIHPPRVGRDTRA